MAPRHLLGNDLVREARRRARLTQRELAERAGTTQSAIARLEGGHTSPSFEAVLSLVRHCGLDLDIMLAERDRSDMWQAGDLARLAPAERVERHRRIAHQMLELRRAGGGASVDLPELDVRAVLSVLAEHGVRFVLVGGMAAVVHGSPFPTEDIDLTPEVSRENLARLSTALTELDARIRAVELDEPLPFGHDADSLAAVQVWNLVTPHGVIDISMVPTGTEGYADLIRDAVPETIFGVEVRVASLADVIRCKQAANRPKDQRVLPTLREILARRDQPGS